MSFHSNTSSHPSFHDYASSKPPYKKRKTKDVDGSGSEKEDGEIEDDDERGSEKEVYCICRTSDTSRFMIGCDNCEEWYHGDCINITEEYAKRIQTFYCRICTHKDNSLQIKFKEKKIPPKKKESVKEVVEKKIEKEEEEETKEDPDYREPVSRSRDYSSGGDDEEDEDYYEPNRRARKHGREKSTASKSKRQKGRTTNARDEKKNKPRRKYNRRDKKEEGLKKTHKKNKDYSIEVEEKVKQCYGPECVNAARKGSKYCSDECGLKLAHNRIIEILPTRIQQWQNTPCKANEISQQQMEEIKREKSEVTKALSELDEKQAKLDEIIKEGKATPPEEDDDADNETESELNIYCVTCGHEVNHRFAMKHMERCFNKHEGQTSFGSIFKTKIEGQTVFCDVYNPHQRTYCKRLRIMCPEHSKEPKITDEEVCGCPLVENVFDETGKFCRQLKKKCNRHYCWEKLRRAELDTLRIQQWLKMDDLFEREQKIKNQMQNRCGILGLMLHQTSYN